MNLTQKQKPRLEPFGNFWRLNSGRILLIIFLGVFAHASGLTNSFVSDDWPLLKSPYLKNPFQQLLDEPVSAVFNSVTYSLNYLLHGQQSLGYHLVNVVLHVIFSLLAYFFLTLLTNQNIAFLASLIFSVLPLHTEAVFWISGRHYILYSLFWLLALIFYFYYTQRQKKRIYYFLSLLSFIFSIYSFPEMAMVFPLLLPLLDFTTDQSLKNRLKLYAPFFILALLFASLSLGRVQNRVENLKAEARNPLTKTEISFIVSDAIALTAYLKLFLLPLGLSFYHEDLSLTPLEFVFDLLIVVGLITLLFIFLKKNRILFFGLGIFFVGLSPTLTPWRVSWIVAERYAYFGSLGLTLIFAYGLNKLKDLNWSKSFYQPLLYSLIAFYSILTFLRGFDWRDEDSLWLATVKASPTSSKAWNNMGDYYGRHNDPKKSFAAFVRATEINPSYADAWHNAGNVLLQSGKINESIPYFEKSLKFNPQLIEAYNNLALAYRDLGQATLSAQMIQKSLSANPNSPKTFTLLAKFEFDQGNLGAAKDYLLKAWRLDPTNPSYQQNLDFLETKIGEQN